MPIGHRALGDDRVACRSTRCSMRCGRSSKTRRMRKVGHDLKFDAILLARHGVTLARPRTSTRCWRATCWTPPGPSHRLEDLALEHTELQGARPKTTCAAAAPRRVSLADVPVEAAVDYAGERADLAGQLAPMLRDLLTEEQLDEVYATLELPLIPVLVDVERAGVRIDARRAGGAVAAGSSRSWPGGRREIFELAGGEFNINSPKQLAEVLFDKLQLPVLKRTGTSKRAVDRGRSARGAGARRTTCRA